MRGDVMILITGGCSFSTVGKKLPTWPKQIEDNYADQFSEVVHTGYPGWGNGLIMRKLIHTLEQYKYSDEKILLLVMWSGYDRHHYLTTDSEYISTKIFDDARNKYQDHLIQQFDFNKRSREIGFTYWTPGLVPEIPQLHSYLLNYSNQHDGWEHTTQNMIQLQQYCELNNIDYHWMTFTNAWQEYADTISEEHYDVHGWLLDLLNFDNRITDQSLYDWTKQNIGNRGLMNDDYHPIMRAHRLYAKHVIMPYLDQSVFRTN